MKKILLTTLVFATGLLLAQSERFDVIKYSLNSVEVKDFQPETQANAYVEFTIYKNKKMFILGVGRDSTFSYGFIEKINEKEINPLDSANLVIFNEYKWYYANTYDYKTGIAKIETLRLFYNNSMLVVISIYILDNNDTIDIVAKNNFYK